MGALLSIFLAFHPVQLGIRVSPEWTDYEQRCHAGCLISYPSGSDVDLLRQCDAYCEDYDGEAG